MQNRDPNVPEVVPPSNAQYLRYDALIDTRNRDKYYSLCIQYNRQNSQSTLVIDIIVSDIREQHRYHLHLLSPTLQSPLPQTHPDLLSQE